MLATIHLPETMAKLVEQVAQASKSSHETVLLEWLEHPIGYPNQENFDSFLERMDTLSNIQLWTLVYRQVPDEEEARYQTLMDKRSLASNLSEIEQDELDAIVEISNLNVLLRSQAIVVLKERGEDIRIFLSSQQDEFG